MTASGYPNTSPGLLTTARDRSRGDDFLSGIFHLSLSHFTESLTPC